MNACAMSYGKSVQNVTGNRVSRQTVMNKVRESHVPPTLKRELRKVSVPHIDADENHVTLCGGKNAIVSLVSVYEGIAKHGKRGECVNVFHIGSYGKKTEDIGDEVLTELEQRYDLSGTVIYLHGDGANWIRSGSEYLPNAVFVLDPYHKSKYLRQSVRDMGEKSLLFSRPARPRSGRPSSCPFRQGYASFQRPPPFLTQNSYNNLTRMRKIFVGILRAIKFRPHPALRATFPRSAGEGRT